MRTHHKGGMSHSKIHGINLPMQNISHQELNHHQHSNLPQQKRTHHQDHTRWKKELHEKQKKD